MPVDPSLPATAIFANRHHGSSFRVKIPYFTVNRAVTIDPFLTVSFPWSKV
jgi:hypothetical protein